MCRMSGKLPILGFTLAGLVLAGGCLFERESEPVPPPTLPPPGDGPPNGVELTVYFVSYPTRKAAPRFATGYWPLVDENVTAPDVGALWRANGLRLGRTGPLVIGKAHALHEARGDDDGGGCTLRRLRVPHRGSVILAAGVPEPRGTFLLTLPGGRALVRTLPGASVALHVTCRLVDEETAYVEVVPKVLRPGRGPTDEGLVDFLTTEMACKRSEAIVVGSARPIGQPVCIPGRG